MFFKENLSYLRRKIGLTQDAVANKTDLSRQTIAAYEKGSREPSLDRLIKIAAFFDISIDNLLTKDMRPMGSFVGGNLKFLRNRIHAKEEEMARILKVSKSIYSKYENCLVEPNIQGLINISDFFGVAVDDLLKKNLSENEAQM